MGEWVWNRQLQGIQDSHEERSFHLLAKDLARVLDFKEHTGRIMTCIADNNTRTKHDEEIAFFNALVIDLKKVIKYNGNISVYIEKTPEGIVVDSKRLEEATRHLAKLSECKEQMRWK